MPRLARPLLLALLFWNGGLVGLSWWLAESSERAHPPIGEIVTVEGRRVHVSDTGPPPGGGPAEDRPPLVLLHGASTSLLDFEPSLVPALAEHHRLVSVDRPGHGYSQAGERWADPYEQARIVSEVLETLGIERAIWIGHSWSGAVVLAAALEEHERVAGGVLIAGVTHPWEGGSARHVELAAHPLIGPVLAWQYIEPIGRVVLDAAVAAVFAPEPVPEGYADGTGLTLSLRPPTYLADARDRTRLSEHLEDQSRRYGEIDRPLLSLTGTGDTVVPPANHDARLATVLPTLRTVAFEDAGHALHHTRTARVAAEIERFAASLPR